MKLWDNHMHCHFSGDSDADPLDMIEKARQLGLSGITFTDHLDLDYKEEPASFRSGSGCYAKKPCRLCKKRLRLSLYFMAWNWVCNRILHKSMPICLHPMPLTMSSALCMSYIREILTTLFILRGAILRKPIQNIIRPSMRTWRHFTILTLWDIWTMSFAMDRRILPSLTDTYTPYAPLIDDILRFLIAHDIALEVNTGAFRCGLSVPNPCPQILKRYHELGGKLITIGADAHKPSDIALGFDRLPGFLASCGFDEYMVYLHRVPHPHSIY